jgi:hypothetical protein
MSVQSSLRKKKKCLLGRYRLKPDSGAKLKLLFFSFSLHLIYFKTRNLTNTLEKRKTNLGSVVANLWNEKNELNKF